MVDVVALAARPRVTIITPVYDERENLARFESRVAECLLSRADCDFRVLFIDDGSGDGSWDQISSICSRDPRFSAIRLSRNYGSHVALSAGFAAAGADAVATLACDLQDPPEVILEFVAAWRRGAKIVWGRRRTRQDGAWRALASQVFQELLARAMPRGSKFTTGSFLLVDRLVTQCFNQFQEHNRITFAIVAWTGFEQAVVDYDRLPRTGGRSKWSYGRLLKTMYDAFVGFSLLPIRVMTIAGLSVSMLAVGLLVYVLLAWLTGRPAPGWTSQMLLLAFFFGIQFLLMGIIGEYLYRIYAEVVRRPLYFVSETIDQGRDEG
jgi:dolichol-phosphate mannosyltransferase